MQYFSAAGSNWLHSVEAALCGTLKYLLTKVVKARIFINFISLTYGSPKSIRSKQPTWYERLLWPLSRNINMQSLGHTNRCLLILLYCHIGEWIVHAIDRYFVVNRLHLRKPLHLSSRTSQQPHQSRLSRIMYVTMFSTNSGVRFLSHGCTYSAIC